jgi:polysaccharide deacetylase family protein (PEP-CTERM system associated)
MEPTPVRNALTFDVEEYFHAEVFAGVVRPEEWPTLESRVVSVTERLLDILDYAGARATFFVLGWVADRHRGLVKEIDGRGHEVACHGYAHRMIHRLRPAELLEDVSRAKGALEDATGRAVLGYRAPTFSVTRDTLWSLDVLCEAGFRYDSSIYPIVHDRYGIPDAPRFPHRRRTPSGAEITEFPMSTVELLGWRLPVAGGGYFRLAPYAVTRAAIRRLNQRERRPVIVYLHPWELDPVPPRLPMRPLARLRHSVSIENTEDKLRRMLAEFDFAPAAEILAEVGLLPSETR